MMWDAPASAAGGYAAWPITWSRKGAFDHDHWVGFGEERVQAHDVDGRVPGAGEALDDAAGGDDGYCRGAVAPITIIVRMNIMLRRQAVTPNSLPISGRSNNIAHLLS
jgi:hypothetical protein